MRGGASGVGRPISCELPGLQPPPSHMQMGQAAAGAAVLRELVDFAFADGLLQIEGWLDFEQAAEDLEALENGVWNGGTTLSKAERQEDSSVLIKLEADRFLGGGRDGQKFLD